MTFSAQVAGHICLDLTHGLAHQPDLTAGGLKSAGLLSIHSGAVSPAPD